MTEHPTETALAGSQVTRARIGVLAHFAAAGVSIGLWASRLPAIKDALRLEDSQLAFVTFLAAIGAMLSLRAAGPLIERFGSRRTTQIAGVLVMLALLLFATAQSLTWLVVAGVASFAAASFQDVGMNAQAVAVERRMGRPMMSSFHAAFSIGMIAGAGAGALTARFDVSFRTTLAVGAFVLAAAVLVANQWLLDAPETARREGEKAGRLPRRGLLLAFGLVGLASFVAEGAAVDWTAIYLRDNTGASASVAAAGLVVYNVAMTAGRLVGDRLALRFGSMLLVRAGTLVAGLGMGAGLATGTTVGGFVGVTLLGLGLSVVVPQVFSAAGTVVPDRAPAALSVISSISYAGFLAGPAAIGALAHWVGLDVALYVPVVLVLVAAIVAGRVHRAVDASAAERQHDEQRLSGRVAYRPTPPRRTTPVA